MNPLPAFSHLSLREPPMALFTGGNTPDGDVKHDADLSEVHDDGDPDGKVQDDDEVEDVEHKVRMSLQVHSVEF